VRAVVTGSAGFAGSWLVRQLVQNGFEVSGWTHRTEPHESGHVLYKQVDICDRAAVEQAMLEDRPNVVFHLAAMTHVADCMSDPEGANAVNVQGTINVIDSMPKTARAVVASTCHVYGRPNTGVITEQHPTSPIGVYAQTKLAAETAVLERDMDVVVARAFHHTGPGQSTRYVMADWAQQLRTGQETITVGDLSLRRDFTDVRDVVRGYIMLMTHGKSNEVYNLCSGSAPSLGEMLDWLSGNPTVQARAQLDRFRDDDVEEFRGDPSKAEAIGWTRQIDLKETLRMMAL
jgi:nucleoside-diphosphate-sugar epimerase